MFKRLKNDKKKDSAIIDESFASDFFGSDILKQFFYMKKIKYDRLFFITQRLYSLIFLYSSFDIDSFLNLSVEEKNILDSVNFADFLDILFLDFESR